MACTGPGALAAAIGVITHPDLVLDVVAFEGVIFNLRTRHLCCSLEL
jgi:hypothetical protein